MAPLVRRPSPDAACANPRTIRRFGLLKLLVWLLLVVVLLVLLVVSPQRIVAPSLDAPPADLLAGELLLAGGGEPGSIVELLVNGRLMGTTTVGKQGRWQWSASFTPGQYALLAQTVDESGQPIFAPSGQAQLNVVARPTLELSVSHKADGTADVRLFGEGTPHSTVRLLWNDAPQPNIGVDDGGRWQLLLPSVPVPSESAFMAEVLDRQGGVLGASTPRQLVLAAAQPVFALLRIEYVQFGQLRRSGQRETVSGELVVTGAGEPHALIAVTRAADGTTAAGKVRADGAWEVPMGLDVTPGAHSFTVRMATPDGQTLDDGAFELIVPAPPVLRVAGGPSDIDNFFLSGAAQPDETITLFSDDIPLGTVRADATGQWRHAAHLTAGPHRLVAVSATGLASDPLDVSVALARPVILGQNRDERDKTLPGFYGEGRPDAWLEIIADNAVIGQIRVTAQGEWVCHCTLAPGEHTVSVREVAEPVRASDTLIIVVENPVVAFVPGVAADGAPPFRCPDSSPPGVLDGMVYIIGCGESLSLIATRLGVTVDDLLAHNPQLSQPPMVYFGQRLNVPAGAACFDVAPES
jgi:large repetitive protein